MVGPIVAAAPKMHEFSTGNESPPLHTCRPNRETSLKWRHRKRRFLIERVPYLVSTYIIVLGQVKS